MTLVYINTTIKNMTPEALKEKLEYSTYVLTVLTTHSDAEVTKTNVEKFEFYMLESLLRVLEKNLGFRPMQNKLFENVEKVFGVDNQDSYNINRMLSGIRRAKMFGIDAGDEKYIRWFENRITYSVKTLKAELDELVETKYGETV
jgi:hypothetical protein